MGKLKSLFLATRPQFLPAVAAPVLVGAAAAWHFEREFSPLFFALSLFAALCYHAGMNVLNDYYDYRNGADELNRSPLTPFAGGSRFIQAGLLTPRETLILGAGLVLSGTLTGLYLAWATTPLLLVIGAIGLFAGYFYSAPPLFLAGRGLGEATVAICFGLLTVIGSFVVQTNNISIEAVFASFPLSFLIAGLLFINEFPDFESDRLSGKRNLVVRLGPALARYALLGIVFAAYASIVAGVILGLMPHLAIISLLAAIPAFASAIGLIRHYEDGPSLVPAIKSIILAHLATGLLQAVSFVLA